jgi:hypothetical protein
LDDDTLIVDLGTSAMIVVGEIKQMGKVMYSQSFLRADRKFDDAYV